MPALQLRRTLTLSALAIVCWFAAQSCVSNRLLCPAQDTSQSAGAPCDIYAAAHTACAAAFSTTRALYKSYAGPLYQVTRKSDGKTSNIGLLSDGFANAATQDAFCSGTTCTITKIFDQSPHHNDLGIAPPGTYRAGQGPGGYDLPADAMKLPVTAGGHKVYGIYMLAGMGYRDDTTVGIAVNGQPEGVYMVASGTRFNSGCCFDFGNAETNDHDNGPGHMDAVNLRCDSASNLHVGLDMEAGTYPPFSMPSNLSFVTAMGANDGQKTYSVYWGNAQQGCLTSSGLLSLPPKATSPCPRKAASSSASAETTATGPSAPSSRAP